MGRIVIIYCHKHYNQFVCLCIDEYTDYDQKKLMMNLFEQGLLRNICPEHDL